MIATIDEEIIKRWSRSEMRLVCPLAARLNYG